MELSTILVIFFVVSTICLLVWVELRSRRNRPAPVESSPHDTAKKEQVDKQQ